MLFCAGNVLIIMLAALCSSSMASEESHSMGSCCGEICCLSCSCAIFSTISLLKRSLHLSVIQLFIPCISLLHAFSFTTVFSLLLKIEEGCTQKSFNTGPATLEQFEFKCLVQGHSHDRASQISFQFMSQLYTLVR